MHGSGKRCSEELPLAGKARTIGEMLAEARQKSGAEKLAGHDIMALERFAPDTRHMIVLDVLSHESPMGYKGERYASVPHRAGIPESQGEPGQGIYQDQKPRQSDSGKPPL